MALKVTYTSGRVEIIEDADKVSIDDRNSVTLSVFGREVYFRRELIKTLVLANVESYEWTKP